MEHSEAIVKLACKGFIVHDVLFWKHDLHCPHWHTWKGRGSRKKDNNKNKYSGVDYQQKVWAESHQEEVNVATEGFI